MDIISAIQHYISCYDGSEKRVVQNSIYECRCTEIQVSANIDLLIRKKFIKVVKPDEMNKAEKGYYNDDGYCRIFRNIKYFNLVEFSEEEKKRINEESKLPNEERFILYVERLEEEFNYFYPLCQKNYTIAFDDNEATINYLDETENIVIDLSANTSLEYFELSKENYILHKCNGKYYKLELREMLSKYNIMYYSDY